MTRFLVAREMFAEEAQGAIRGRLRVDRWDGGELESEATEAQESGDTAESTEDTAESTEAADKTEATERVDKAL